MPWWWRRRKTTNMLLCLEVNIKIVCTNFRNTHRCTSSQPGMLGCGCRTHLGFFLNTHMNNLAAPQVSLWQNHGWKPLIWENKNNETSLTYKHLNITGLQMGKELYVKLNNASKTFAESQKVIIAVLLIHTYYTFSQEQELENVWLELCFYHIKLKSKIG